MFYGNRIKSLTARFNLAVVLLFPLTSEAGTGAPFDLEGFILRSVLYLLGFVVFPFLIGFSKEKAAKRFWSCLFAVYVIGPAAYIFAEVKLNSMRNARIMEEVKVGRQRNLEAFGKYCKGRTPIVHSKATLQDGISLAVRIEKNFTGVPSQFNAHSLFEYLGHNRSLCTRIGVTVLEGVYVGAYSRERNGYEKEVRRYMVCTKDKWTIVPEFQSRYDLVLGQIGRKDPIPWRGGGNQWMSNSSIQIIDRLTRKVLAEDTMYFLEQDTGEGGCPAGLEQLSNLLVEVFGRQ